MEKEAASGLSRLLTFVSQYPIAGGKAITKDRIKLLNYLGTMEKDINDIEAILTGFADSSIASAFYRFSKFVSLFDKLFISNFSKFNIAITGITQSPIEPKEQIENKPQDYYNIAQSEINYVPKIIVLLESQSISQDILSNIKSKSDSLEKALAIKGPVESLYLDLKSYINDAANTKLPFIRDIALALDKISTEKISKLHPSLQKLARKRLERFMKRLRLGLTGKLEHERILELAKMLNNLSKIMDHTQDLLEKKDFEHSYNDLIINVKSMYNELSIICKEFADLAKDFNDTVGENNIKSKNKLHLIRTTDIGILRQKGVRLSELAGEM